MDDVKFKVARWGLTWDEILSENSANVQGVAKLESSRVSLDIPFGQILSDGNFLSMAGEDDLPRSVDYLYGFTQNGRYIVLVDAYGAGTAESYPGGPHQTVRASEILEGRERFDPGRNVIEVTSKILGLREWFGEAPFSAVHLKNENKTIYELDMDKAVEQNAMLFPGEEYFIKLYHIVRELPLEASGFSVSHDCGIQIKFDKAIDRKKALNIMRKVSDFISMCVGFDAQLSELAVKFEGDEREVGCYRPFVCGAKPSQLQLINFPIPYKDVQNDLEGILCNWLNATDGLQEAEDILCSLLFNSWKFPLDLEFIASAQLLELLSKYHADRHALPEEIHEAYRKAVGDLLAKIEDRDLYEWVENRLSSNNKGQKRLLDELLARHEEICEWLLPNKAEFVKRHIAMRNHFTHRHGGRAVLAPEELFWHTEGVLLLCFGIVAELVGIPASTIVKSVGRSNYKNYSIWRFRELYAAR